MTTERLGTEYGGYVICPELIAPNSTVYSFGIGCDISFDTEMIEKFGVNDYAFDPTPRSIDWVSTQQTPERFQFFSYGIGAHDGTAVFYPPENSEWVSHSLVVKEETVDKAIEVPIRRLITIMNQLGHDRIDVLKMDIEGAEYEVIDDILASNIEFDQLVVEVHHRFKGLGPKKTKAMIESLNKNGYRIFHVSSNGDVYGFVKLRD